MTKTFNERFDEVFLVDNHIHLLDKNCNNSVKPEEIKQFIQDEIGEVLEEIEKQRIPPNTLVAVTIWNRCIDKAKQIINKRFKGE